MKRSVEKRYDRYGEMRLMAEADNYVLARRSRCSPFAITRKEWDGLGRYPYDHPKLIVVNGSAP